MGRHRHNSVDTSDRYLDEDVGDQLTTGGRIKLYVSVFPGTDVVVYLGQHMKPQDVK